MLDNIHFGKVFEQMVMDQLQNFELEFIPFVEVVTPDHDRFFFLARGLLWGFQEISCDLGQIYPSHLDSILQVLCIKFSGPILQGATYKRI